MKAYVRVPVTCQNGHRGLWTLEIDGLEVRGHAPPRDVCDCPKWAIGEGWRAAGRPLWLGQREIGPDLSTFSEAEALDSGYRWEDAL